MRRTRRTATLATGAAVLVLGVGAASLASAHSSGPDGPVEPAAGIGAPEPPPSEEASAPGPAPQADEDETVGQSRDGGASPSPAAAPTPSAPVRSTRPSAADLEPAPAAQTSSELSAQGHVRKDLGEAAGLSADGTKAVLFALTVDEIDVSSSCPGRGFDPVPEHGHFVTVDVDAHMAAEMARHVPSGTDAFLPLVPEAFGIVGPDGTVQHFVATGSAWACLDEAELAPPFVEPGERVAGKIVLDSRTSSGTVVYDPDGTGGWEWPFG